MPLLFAATLFASATLLFMVQPMVGKKILPLLGGSPAAWNTCMVFFQGLLLLGYLYAHHLTKRFPPGRQVVVHLGVLAMTAGWLLVAAVLSPDSAPVAVFKSLAPQGEAYPMGGVLALLLVAVGLPFLVLSTSAPLLQKWFADTNHPSSADPYFLYAASNAGSLISLLGYPLFIEPTLTLAAQAWLWAGGFLVLMGLVALCGRAAANPLPPLPKNPDEPLRNAEFGMRNGNHDPSSIPRSEFRIPSFSRRLRWLALAFVPSSLMLGVTFHMTTDVASVPLLWVIPLALYLLTFIIAYMRLPGWFRPVIGNVSPVVTLLLVFVMISGVLDSRDKVFFLLMAHLGAYFLTALLMHSELALDRPDPEHLTSYFLWISLGGVMGGVFNSLVAPVAFPSDWEYKIAIAVGCLLVPVLDPVPVAATALAGFRKRLPAVLDLAFPLLMFGMAAGLLRLKDKAEWFSEANEWAAGLISRGLGSAGVGAVVDADKVALLVVFAVPCMVCFLFIDRPVRFGLCVAAVLAAAGARVARAEAVEIGARSFFGILKVERQVNQNDAGVGYKMTAPPPAVATDPEMPIFREYTLVPDKQLAHDCFLIARRRIDPATGAAGWTGTVAGVERYYKLMHGTTLHGQQASTTWTLPVRDDLPALGAMTPWGALLLNGARAAWDFRQEPLTYYHRTGPVGAIFRQMRAKNPTAAVAMVGLGTGSAACYALPGQNLTFYEIDPTVKDIVEVPRLMNPDEVAEGLKPVMGPFTFVHDARNRGAAVDFVLGDARIKLDENKDAKYGLLLVDAFSSDSIPVHLLTREALELYMQRLAPHGLLALHISNRYIRLEPVAARLAKEAGLAARVWNDEDDDAPGKTRSSWIVLAKDRADLGVLGEDRLAQAAALFPRTAGLVETARHFDEATPLAVAVRKQAGLAAARLAWLADRHGTFQDFEAARTAERAALDKLKEFAKPAGDGASLRALLLRQLFEAKPTPLAPLLGPHDPAEAMASVLKGERDANPARPDLLKIAELWTRTNEVWLAANPGRATLLGGVEKDSGPLPARFPEWVEKYGSAGTLQDVVASADAAVKPALDELAKKFGRDAALRDVIEKEYGEPAGRLVELIDRYSGPTSVRTVLDGEQEALKALDGIAGRLPKGVTLRSVIMSEYGRDPAAAPLGPYVARAGLAPERGQFFNGYRLTSPLRVVLDKEVGDLFRDVRVLDGVPAWTDDYSDVLRVLDVEQVQWVRNKLHLPTPLLSKSAEE